MDYKFSAQIRSIGGKGFFLPLISQITAEKMVMELSAQILAIGGKGFFLPLISQITAEKMVRELSARNPLNLRERFFSPADIAESPQNLTSRVFCAKSARENLSAIKPFFE